MNSKNTNIIIWVVVGLIIIGGIFFLYKQTKKPAPLDAFAQCLGEKGAIFYGAFWCSHCQNQKALFGRSQKYLPYFECSTPDGRGQIQECTDKGVTGYPYWTFADGTTLSGEIPLAKLAEKTSCELPEK